MNANGNWRYFSGTKLAHVFKLLTNQCFSDFCDLMTISKSFWLKLKRLTQNETVGREFIVARNNLSTFR